MVSAFPLCLLIVAVSVVSSQEISNDSESFAPISERRTFKHGKPVKVLPLIKKHKKFSALAPFGFGKAHLAQVPVIHEAPARPIYKIHRYQGIEYKPVSDVSIPAPTTFESSPVVHSSDFEHSFSSQPEFSSPPSPSNVFLYSVNDKPIFPSSAISSPPPSFHAPPSFHSPPVFASLPPQSPVFTYVPAPQPAPVLPSFPIHLPPVTIQSGPVLPSISIAKPSPAPILSSVPAAPQQLPPTFNPLPAPLPPHFSFPSLPYRPPVTPIFSPIPAKLPAPILPPLPSPSPAPAFSSVSIVTPSAPPTFSAIPPTALPSPAPIVSISVPEPEFPYPPSGTPIPSYIKDISLPEISVTDPTPTKVVTPNYEEVTVGATIGDGSTKNFGHVLGTIKGENGLLQKLKGWKAEKASAAINHITQFKQKPIAISHPPVSAPALSLPQVPAYPSLQFPGPSHPLPLTPDFRPPAVFLPQTPQFFPLGKYENFPPNNIEPPPLFNSYGAPIPHDSYATTISHSSHDRLSPDASEEEPSILPAPQVFGEQKQEQNLKELQQQLPEIQQQTSQIRQNFQPQFQPQATISQEQPIYVPENNQNLKEEIKAEEESQPVRNVQPEEAFQSEEPEDPNLQNHRT